MAETASPDRTSDSARDRFLKCAAPVRTLIDIARAHKRLGGGEAACGWSNAAESTVNKAALVLLFGHWAAFVQFDLFPRALDKILQQNKQLNNDGAVRSVVLLSSLAAKLYDRGTVTRLEESEGAPSHTWGFKQWRKIVITESLTQTKQVESMLSSPTPERVSELFELLHIDNLMQTMPTKESAIVAMAWGLRCVVAHQAKNEARLYLTKTPLRVSGNEVRAKKKYGGATICTIGEVQPNGRIPMRIEADCAPSGAKCGVAVNMSEDRTSLFLAASDQVVTQTMECMVRLAQHIEDRYEGRYDTEVADERRGRGSMSPARPLSSVSAPAHLDTSISTSPPCSPATDSILVDTPPITLDSSSPSTPLRSSSSSTSSSLMSPARFASGSDYPCTPPSTPQ